MKIIFALAVMSGLAAGAYAGVALEQSGAENIAVVVAAVSSPMPITASQEKGWRLSELKGIYIGPLVGTDMQMALIITDTPDGISSRSGYYHPSVKSFYWSQDSYFITNYECSVDKLCLPKINIFEKKYQNSKKQFSDNNIIVGEGRLVYTKY